MYDRAYQNSILVGSNYPHQSRTSSAAIASHNIVTVGESELLHEEEIDEPSSLGDDFAALTSERPFGADMEASDLQDGVKEREEARRRGGGVMGLLSEVYQDSRRWS